MHLLSSHFHYYNFFPIHDIKTMGGVVLIYVNHRHILPDICNHIVKTTTWKTHGNLTRKELLNSSSVQFNVEGKKFQETEQH